MILTFLCECNIIYAVVMKYVIKDVVVKKTGLCHARNLITNVPVPCMKAAAVKIVKDL